MKGIKSILILLLVALMAGCATVSVYNDFDPRTDFSILKTYGWWPESSEKMGDERIDNNPTLHARIHAAIDTKLTLKGFQKMATGAPDFSVRYYVIAEDKKDILRLQPSIHDSLDSKWSDYFGDGGVATFHYTEGTLIVNIADPQTQKLIWRGIARVVVDPNASPEKKTSTVNNVVAKILAAFPPQKK